MTRKMKDSGIEWIGEIPESWETCRVKNILIQGKDGIRIGPFGSSLKAEYIFEEEEYKVYGQENLINDDFSIGKNYISFEKFSELSSCEVKPGDITFSMMGTIGKCSVVPEGIEKGIMNSHLIRLRIDINKISTSYFKRYFNNNSFAEKQFDILSKGTIMSGLNSTIIKSIIIVLPPLREQTCIATYLDSKCTKIDETIEKQKQVIDKLKAYKQSVITEAVTKGLNSDVPMKDSGVEWIGEIPESWQFLRLKGVIKEVESGISAVTGNDSSKESTSSVLRTSSVSSGVFKPDECITVLESEKSRLICPVEKNTLIVSRMNTATMVGSSGYVDRDYPNLYLPDKLWKVKFTSLINVKYAWYLLNSHRIRAWFASTATGASSSMINISLDDFASTRVPIPSINEQHRIIKYLDKLCCQIDKTIEQKQKIIEKLTYYKKSLIYECVTGKRQV